MKLTEPPTLSLFCNLTLPPSSTLVRLSSELCTMPFWVVLLTFSDTFWSGLPPAMFTPLVRMVPWR